MTENLNACQRNALEAKNDYVRSLATSLFNKLYEEGCDVAAVTDKAIKDAETFINELHERTKV